jgi:hypothetical protein
MVKIFDNQTMSENPVFHKQLHAQMKVMEAAKKSHKSTKNYKNQGNRVQGIVDVCFTEKISQNITFSIPQEEHSR